jgi:hypothetical protein
MHRDENYYISLCPCQNDDSRMIKDFLFFCPIEFYYNVSVIICPRSLVFFSVQFVIINIVMLHINNVTRS